MTRPIWHSLAGELTDRLTDDKPDLKFISHLRLSLDRLRFLPESPKVPPIGIPQDLLAMADSSMQELLSRLAGRGGENATSDSWAAVEATTPDHDARNRMPPRMRSASDKRSSINCWAASLA